MPVSIGIVVVSGAVALGGGVLASELLHFGDSLVIAIFSLILVVCAAYGLWYGFNGSDGQRISMVKSVILAIIYTAVQLAVIYFSIIVAMFVIFANGPE